MYLLKVRTDRGRFQRWKTFGRFVRMGSRGRSESKRSFPLCLLWLLSLQKESNEEKSKRVYFFIDTFGEKYLTIIIEILF